MSGHRLGRRDGERTRVLAEALLDRQRLDLVVVGGRRPVRVDVVHHRRLHARLVERRLHHPQRAVPVLGRRRHVMSVGGHAVADQLGVCGRSARAGMLQLLQNEHAGTLADNEPVAVLVERPAGPLRLVVARGQGAHGREAADAHRRDGSLRPARNHHVGGAAAHHLAGVPDGVRRGRAGGAGGGVRPAGPETDGHLAGRQVDDGRGDEEGRYLARTTLEQRAVLALDGGEAANARGDEHAGPRPQRPLQIHAGILQREGRRRHRVLDEHVHLPDVLPADELERIEAADLARDAGGESVGIEVRYGPDSAPPGAQGVPGRPGADPQRRHQTHTRDDYPSARHRLCLSVRQSGAATASPWHATRCTRPHP